MAKKLGLMVSIGLCFVFITFLPNFVEQAVAAKKIYRVEFRTTTFGGSSYILGFGMADILNKKSDWIKGSVLESSGTPENIKIVGQDAKKRKRTIFTMVPEMWDKARKGLPPFEENPGLYKKLMIMMSQQKLAATFITLDPKIKTLADLKGKRVATWPKGTTKFDESEKLLAGAGKDVLNSIHWQYTGYAGYDDLIIGKTDAAYTFCPERGKGKYATIPKLKELMSKRKVYFVTATSEMREKTRKEYGDVYGATLKIPENSFGKGTPNRDIVCMNLVLGWGVYADFPEDVLYDIIKVLDDNHSMLGDYHPAGKYWNRQTYGAYPVPKEYFHPAARKYFDEHGIKYGVDYFFEEYPIK